MIDSHLSISHAITVHYNPVGIGTIDVPVPVKGLGGTSPQVLPKFLTRHLEETLAVVPVESETTLNKAHHRGGGGTLAVRGYC